MSRHVVIIGAGAVGCLSAIELARRGWQVTLADRGAIGGEASWAGGGILFPLLPWNYTEPVNRLALAGAARYPQLCAELRDATKLDPEFQKSGMLALGDFGGNAALDWCRSHRMPHELQGDALWLPEVGQVRNPRLMQALRMRLQQLGVRLCEGMEMLPLAVDASHVASWSSLGGERLEADIFVVTAGAWSRSLMGGRAIELQHKPMRGQMLLYRAKPGLLTRVLYQEDFYLIPRLDGHVLAGSTVEDVGFDKSTTAEAAAMLAAKAVALLPALADAPIVRHWSGLRPGSPDNVPVIAAHPAFDNLYLNTGHFRYGVTMAPASAELLAQLISGEALPEAGMQYRYP